MGTFMPGWSSVRHANSRFQYAAYLLRESALVPAYWATLRHHVVSVFGQVGEACPSSYVVTSSVDRGSVAYGEEGPQTGDPLQFVLATLAEVDSGAHDEVLEHSRYDYLTRRGECSDASRDMDC
jgi:hypothetical protein